MIFCLLCAKLSTWRIEQASSMLLRLVAFLHFICLEAEKTRRKTAGEWKEHSIVLATKQSINFFFYFGKSYLCGLGFWYCGVFVCRIRFSLWLDNTPMCSRILLRKSGNVSSFSKRSRHVYVYFQCALMLYCWLKKYVSIVSNGAR